MKIKMASYLMEGVRYGSKRVTIREGHRHEYHTGPCEIEDANNPEKCVLVNVHTIVFTDVNRMPLQYLYADGFANVDHMVESMRKFYPNFSQDSLITIVAWERL